MADFIANPVAFVISDLHVGDPKNDRLEDFDRDDDFARLLLDVIPSRARGPATLIIGGDFIDFPQVMPEIAWHALGDRIGVAEIQSHDKMKRVIAGHPKVFSALRTFLERGGQLVLLPGNHDVDLHWPAVQEAFRAAIGNPAAAQYLFTLEVHERRIHIEHGNQWSYDNRFEFWKRPIIKAADGERLERPWGTLFMDLVYNDLETLYPFINKIYPHARLAAIALRSLGDEQNVSPKILARLVAFFVTKGKRMIAGHMLGSEKDPPEQRIEQFLQQIATGASRERIQAVAQETAALLAAEGGIALQGAGKDGAGLLGHSDERGLKKRAVELHEAGDSTIVCFGHTHHAIDGNHELMWDASDPRRMFNTGSWMPEMALAEGEAPRWSELEARARSHDVRYLIIEFGDQPSARLEKL